MAHRRPSHRETLIPPFQTKTQLYERLLQEKDKHILILSDQIDYLRQQLGQQNWSKLQAVNPTSQPPVTMGEAPWMDEDEAEVRSWVERGLISEDQLPEVLDGLGISDTEI